MAIATLKDLIISSEDYDEELTKNIHSTIVEDRKAREENLRIEEQKKEKLRIEEREENYLYADTSKESDTKFLVKKVSNFIHRFDLKEDISLYLKLFERQAQRLNIDQENWVSHLLGLLPTEVSYIIAREPDDKANSYEHVKDFLLKHFKPTPEKFRQLFVTHQKAPERTWIDFYHELNTYFNGWIDGLKIDTFKKLSDLIITDQLKRKTPFEFKEYYLDEWANMNSAVQLAEKLKEFEDFKRTLKQKSSSPFVKKQEFRFTEKNRRYEAPGKFEYNRKDKKFPASTNYNKHYEAPVTKYESVQRYQDSAQKGYYNKNYEKHSNHNASKHAQTNYSKSQKFKEPPKPKETCILIVKKGLRTKKIFFGKVKITALIDSGSSVSLLREKTSRRIMDPTKLSKNKMLLTEVIGSYLLEQASISFTKEGVKFNKYENHAQLLQISAENLQEELDLRHVENRQIKKELEKLIQDYKPEKTASTDVTMGIILKDEEPVCQHPRRLAFTERQEVNKQIEEWLNEGIIRPSSAEYASPIVMYFRRLCKKELITRIARWALQLEEFDYEIEHRAGSRMKHVDSLSRYPVMMVCNDTLTSKLKKAQEEDDNIQTLKSLLEKQESEEFFERNGILYKYLNGRELILTPKAMQAELIKLIHENGHFSVGKTEEIVKQEFFIPNLFNVVKKVIVNCVPCILANKKTGKKEGFLNPISKESIPLSTYHVDFIGPLSSTNKNYQHIFTVVDAFTKFSWLYPVKTVSAESALEKLKQRQKTFGNPIRIISDRGSAFTSKLFNDYCDEENIQHLQ
ncbi:hypothetical protein TNCV_1740961 [Trichonephila clavipes]|uniref:RNA-directed DNA polymerase n=1 Tax=Trichonephila clavipes TaxID=2585209 RepID=A0A8X6UTP0_TRICX|nr:hypothetical protein TNCV_1740961 [Trichonephila clavipes]